MKVLLTAINSKYIHSNLAVYSLKAYHDKHSTGDRQVDLMEFTINQPVDDCIGALYQKKPDIVAFSCYIWNIRYVYEVAVELQKLLPNVQIWLGGPEVTFDGKQILLAHPEIAGIMCGEGEETFLNLCQCGFCPQEVSTEIHGIVYRKEGQIVSTLMAKPMDMDQLPFVYEDLAQFSNKIIYYESSRGCPFGCSYCLSSVEKSLRFRSLPLVFRELKHFLDAQIPQVKFVDRTFNCNHERTIKLLQFIKENDNGVTNFHFEIAADLLNEEEIQLLSTLRAGLVQLEIGVQSTNLQTIEAIHRVMDFQHLSQVVQRLNQGANVHLHLDLIAGLPNEDIHSFHQSFNDVYDLEPEQLQLGFLKVLKGSPMAEKSAEYGIIYKAQPPYEVLGTKWISYDDILQLKQIEEMVEVYYNSRQYVHTMKALTGYFQDAYVFYEKMATFYEKHGYFQVKHSRISRYEILYDFMMENVEASKRTVCIELLIFDLYLRENLKTRPKFAKDMKVCKKLLLELYAACHAPKTSHIESFSMEMLDYIPVPEKISSAECERILCEDETMKNQLWVLFDYEERDPLNYNAKVKRF